MHVHIQSVLQLPVVCINVMHIIHKLELGQENIVNYST